MAPWLDALLVGAGVAAAGGWLAWRAVAAVRSARQPPVGGGGCGCSGTAACGPAPRGDGGRRPPVVGAKPANHR